MGTQTTKSELLSSGRSLRGRAEGLDHPGDTNSIRTRSSWAGRLTFDTRGLEGELRGPCALGQSPWSLLGLTGESYSCLSGGFLHSSSTSPKSDHFLVSEYEGTLNKSCPEYFCLVSVSVVFFFAIAYHYLFILWSMIYTQKVKLKSLSRVRLFEIPWTVAYQAPPSMEFSRQEYWSGVPLPSPEDLSDPGKIPGLLHCRQTLYCLSHQGSSYTYLKYIQRTSHLTHMHSSAPWIISNTPVTTNQIKK